MLAHADAAGNLVRYVDRVWQLLTGDEGRRLAVFFLELHMLAVRRGEPYRSVAADLDAAWTTRTATRLELLGVPARSARRGAELLLGAIDGMLLVRSVDVGKEEPRAPASLRALAPWIAEGAALLQGATSNPTPHVPSKYAASRPRDRDGSEMRRRMASRG